MTLKDLLGASFKEGMTIADIETALADRTLVDESELDTRVNNRTAAQKRLLDAANKKADDLSKQLAEAKKKNDDAGNENAGLLERISALETDIAASKRNEAISKDVAAYVALGYSEELARSTAEALADGDTAKVTENMGVFIAQKTQSIEQAVKDQLLKDTKPPAGGGDGGAGGSGNKFTPPAVF